MTLHVSSYGTGDPETIRFQVIASVPGSRLWNEVGSMVIRKDEIRALITELEWWVDDEVETPTWPTDDDDAA